MVSGTNLNYNSDVVDIFRVGKKYMKETGKYAKSLLNHQNWNVFVNDVYADYAIGGPTSAMLIESMTDVFGPFISWSEPFVSETTTYNYYTYINGYSYNTDPCKIDAGKNEESTALVGEGNMWYPNLERVGQYGYYLAESPENQFAGFMAIQGLTLNAFNQYNDQKMGFRPVVKLKNGVKATNNNGVWQLGE